MKPLNPKDFVLDTRVSERDEYHGMPMPVNVGWHDIKTLEPVGEREADDEKG